MYFCPCVASQHLHILSADCGYEVQVNRLCRDFMMCEFSFFASFGHDHLSLRVWKSCKDVLVRRCVLHSETYVETMGLKLELGMEATDPRTFVMFRERDDPTFQAIPSRANLTPFGAVGSNVLCS